MKGPECRRRRRHNKIDTFDSIECKALQYSLWPFAEMNTVELLCHNRLTIGYAISQHFERKSCSNVFVRLNGIRCLVDRKRHA